MSLAAAYMFGRKQGVDIPLADFLAAYKFENNFNDSAKTNNGTGTGTAFSTVQKIAGASSALFNSSNPSYVTIPYSTDFDFSAATNSKPLSVSIWVYFTVDQDSWFISKRDVAVEGEIQLAYAGGQFSWAIFDNQRYIDTGAIAFIQVRYTPLTSVVGRWINLVATYDGVTNSKLYVDKVDAGAPINQNSFARIKNFNQTIKFGISPWSFGPNVRSFKGYMDEVYIINKELTTDQITYVYNKGLVGQSLI